MNDSNEYSLEVSDCLVMISESVRKQHPTTLPSEFDKHDLSNKNMPKLSDFKSLACASENSLSCFSKITKNQSYDVNSEKISAQDHSHDFCFEETNEETSVIKPTIYEDLLPNFANSIYSRSYS